MLILGSREAWWTDLMVVWLIPVLYYELMKEWKYTPRRLASIAIFWVIFFLFWFSSGIPKKNTVQNTTNTWINFFEEPLDK